MIEVLVGIILLLVGAIVGLGLTHPKLRKRSPEREPRGLDEPTDPQDPPILPINPIERAEESIDEQEPDPDPDTDPHYVDEYIRQSTKLDEE